MNSILNCIDRVYDRQGHKLACVAAFFLPLKLAAAYVFFIPLILLGLIRHRGSYSERLAQCAPIVTPLIFFILCISASAIFGLDPIHSFKSIGSLAFYAYGIVVFREISQRTGPERILATLLIGQTIAATHSVIDAGLSGALPGIFLGKVTESGQIALTLISGLGLAFLLGEKNWLRTLESSNGNRTSIRNRFISGLQLRHVALALGNFMSITLWAFAPDYKLGASVSSFISICAILFVVGTFAFTLRMIRDHSPAEQFLQFFTLTLVLPLISSALLVNLKRGPWCGVTIGVLVFLLCYARRYALPLLLGVMVLIISVSPIRTRLAESSAHFFISGGRNVIWQIGLELSTRYPLGIGFNNSAILQKFSLEIPPELKHFHNNFLNIVVESGWLALFLFLWWLVAIARVVTQVPHKNLHSILGVSIGCSILSWQLAGFVEYNVGDSEVMIVVFILLGLLCQISESASISEKSSHFESGVMAEPG